MHRRHATIATTLGPLTVIAADHAVIGLYFDGYSVRAGIGDFGETVNHVDDDPVLGQAATELREYLAGERTSFGVPVRFATGTDLQARIWQLLAAIPFGQVRTYGDIAAELGDRNLSRAVGRAVGMNPVSVIVPCHRVVGSSGRLTGFAGGLARKRHLLTLEQHAVQADALC